MRVVKGGELKPGMFLVDGIITGICMKNPFFDGDPSYTGVDNMMGGFTAALVLDSDYDIVCEPGDDGYTEKVMDMIKSQLDHLNDIKETTEGLLKYLTL